MVVLGLLPALTASALTASAPAVPAPAAPLPPRKAPARGIYLTGHSVGMTQRVQELLDLIQQTELNALVIDFKDDDGILTHRVHPDQLGRLLRLANRKGIYTIARIVTFKDPRAARGRPGMALHRKNGGLWLDRIGAGWLDPYHRESWEYNLGVAKEAVKFGFREIQFDYVRFPSDGDVPAIDYPWRDDRSKDQVIGDFLAWSRAELRPLGVWVSADIFGLVVSVSDDMGIGQSLERLASGADILSPMVYPSHYSRGNYGLPDPEKDPYRTVKHSLEDGIRRLGQDKKGVWRPWLQDFSLRVDYTPELVKDQIRAVEELGIREWLLWNPDNRYTARALKKDSDSRPDPEPW